MPWNWHLLVVANVTAGSRELLDALRKRAGRGPTTIQLIVPATPFEGGREAATRTLEEALTRLREEGLTAEGAVGHADPVIAVTDAWDPKRYDEIIISTLPLDVSKWLSAGVPQRIERLTGARVTHVIAEPPRREPPPSPAPARKDSGILMGPLSVLGWGRAAKERRRLDKRMADSSERAKTSSHPEEDHSPH